MTMYEDRQHRIKSHDAADPKSARARDAVRAYLEAKERTGKLGLTLSEALAEEKEIEAIEQQAYAGKRATTTSEPRPRQLVFDKYPMTAVLRWMGARGWSSERAVATLNKLGASPKLSTVHGNMRAGKLGQLWLPTFSEDELRKLEG